MAYTTTPRNASSIREAHAYEILSGSILDVLEDMESGEEIPNCCWEHVKDADTLFRCLQSHIAGDDGVTDSLLAYKASQSSQYGVSGEQLLTELSEYAGVLKQIADTHRPPQDRDLYQRSKGFLQRFSGSPYDGSCALYMD